MRVLHVEDNAVDADLTRRMVTAQDPTIELDTAVSIAQARQKLSSGPGYDLALLDLTLTDGSGLDLLAEIRQHALPTAVVVLTGADDQDSAIAAMKLGADDYVVKSGLDVLAPVLHDALDHFRQREARYAKPLRVLYAEHNEADIDLTRRHLARHAPHLQLEVARSAEDALALLQIEPDGGTSHCDVLLVDLRLPGQDALSLVKVLRQERGLDLPIVLVSGHGGQEVAIQALKLGVNDFVAKHADYLYELAPTLERAFHQVSLERHQRHLEELVAARTADLTLALHKARAATVAKAAFLANMSHEIRTPLNAIQGLTHLMRRNSPTPQQARHLTMIHDAGEHLLHIVNDVLDLSKMEAGKLHLQLEAVDLGVLVDRVVGLLSPAAAAKGLRVLTDVQTEGLTLSGDPVRLRQALMNYLSNAIKFTEHGSITVRVRPEAITGSSALMRFEVEDTGIGIAPEVLPRLFGAFEQADSSHARRHDGTGLGLAITQQIAALMDGEAGADSTPGQGSRFWLTARLALGSTASAAADAPSDPDQGTWAQACRGKRLLLVEDEPVSLEVMSAVLRSAGLDFDVATSGLEALARVSDTHYDLVLMDLQMPGLDGLEATRRIRQALRGAHLPIIALTASDASEDLERCLAAGMDGLLSKPINPERLFKHLARHLAAPGH